MFRIYSDGASRGNPGISTVAFIILSEDDKLLKKYSKYVGIRTNNLAEYEALILALEYASTMTDKEVTCYMDSELVVKHLNGECQVRNPKLKVFVAESARAQKEVPENKFPKRSTNRHKY